MALYDKFVKEALFADSLTHTNLILFILLKEYITSVRLDDPVFSEEDGYMTKVDTYMYFYKLLKETLSQPFECIQHGTDHVPTRLKALTHGRIERLRDMFEAIEYTHPSSVKALLFSTTISLEDDHKFLPTKDSVFGLFMRRFTLGLHHQSYEEMAKFLSSFLKAYDKFTDQYIADPFALSSTKDNLHLSVSSTREHALETSSKIAASIGQLGGRPSVKMTDLDETLRLSRKLFPELPSLHYTSHLLASRRRNLTEAERNLYSYFETRMASEKSDKNWNDTWAYMAVACANMHLTFGHWHRGKCLEKEALKKALESESKASLRYVKVTHDVLNANVEPFRYDGQLAPFGLHRSVPVALTELRTKFWTMVDSGAAPSETLHTCLLQCIINADCLQPCPMSDVVLSTAFAGMIREFTNMGAIDDARQIARTLGKVLCRFGECSVIRQAYLQMELEQSLRERMDLSSCERLVHALQLCCPWEAVLYQSELERCRGNNVTSHDLLQHVISAVTRRLNERTRQQQQTMASPISVSNSPLAPTAGSSLANTQNEPFSHVNVPTFDEHVPLGGLARLAQLGLRAHLAMVELFLSLEMYAQAEHSLTDADNLAAQYRLYSGQVTIRLLRHALKVAQSAATSDGISIDKLNELVSAVQHQCSRLAKHRCLVFVSRARLRAIDSSNFLPSHTRQLFAALEFYHTIGDQMRIMDILALLAIAFNATGQMAECESVSRAFNQLRDQHSRGVHPNRGPRSIAVL